MIARIVWRYTVINVMMTLEYRGGFFIYMVNTVVVPLISLLVWLMVAQQGVGLPYDRSQFVTYFVLLSVVSMLTSTWLSGFVADNIRLGKLSDKLVRPYSIMPGYLGNNIGEKIIKLPLLLPLVAVVALVFWRDLRLSADPVAWVLFTISLLLAAAVAFLLDYVLGSLAFWVEDVNGLLRLNMVVGALLAGRFVPPALFPPSVAGLIEALPYRYTLSFPIEVLVGDLSTAALLRGFGWQIAYFFGLAACCRLIWHYGLRRYSASGG